MISAKGFNQSLEDKCHRMLNAVEPGTVVPIHRHPTKDESFVILRGKVRVSLALGGVCAPVKKVVMKVPVK